MSRALPHVTLKAAVTLDGRLATATGDSRWISGVQARREAHRLRARCDAVLVGSGTVLADDPALTVRMVRGVDPLRVVLDTRLRTPPGSKLIEHSSKASTLIFHGPDVSERRKRRLRRPGVELCELQLGRGGLRIRRVLQVLAQRDVKRVLVEGGSRVHGSLLDAGLADAVAIFVAPRILGDPLATPLAAGKKRARIEDGFRLTNVKHRTLGDDVLILGDLL